MMAARILSEIRRGLAPYVGQRITLRADRGRKRFTEREGILERIYPNLFVVRLDEKRSHSRVSYSYADVLTKTVELSVNEQGREKQLGLPHGA